MKAGEWNETNVGEWNLKEIGEWSGMNVGEWNLKEIGERSGTKVGDWSCESLSSSISERHRLDYYELCAETLSRERGFLCKGTQPI